MPSSTALPGYAVHVRSTMPIPRQATRKRLGQLDAPACASLLQGLTGCPPNKSCASLVAALYCKLLPPAPMLGAPALTVPAAQLAALARAAPVLGHSLSPAQLDTLGRAAIADMDAFSAAAACDLLHVLSRAQYDAVDGTVVTALKRHLSFGHVLPTFTPQQLADFAHDLVHVCAKLQLVCNTALSTAEESDAGLSGLVGIRGAGPAAHHDDWAGVCEAAGCPFPLRVRPPWRGPARHMGSRAFR